MTTAVIEKTIFKYQNFKFYCINRNNNRSQENMDNDFKMMNMKMEIDFKIIDNKIEPGNIKVIPRIEKYNVDL